MANNNVQNVRFLRNGNLFTSRTLANNALSGYTLTAEMDGSAILARYQEGGDPIKTLVGFVYFKDASNKSITIFDIDDAGADVDQKINELRTEIEKQLGTGITSANTATAQLTALSGTSGDSSATTSVWGAKNYTDNVISTLDYTDTAVDGSYVSVVSEADGIISVSRVALPDASSVADDNKVVTDVTQSKGAITATASNITGIKLAGYAEGSDADIAATDTLGEALGKLQAQINAMDKDASAVDGQVVTTVAEADGKVTETKANVKDLQLGGYAKDTSATGDIASTDTINAALSKLENKAAAITIANADGSINVTTGATGTDIAVNIKSGEKVIKLGNDGIYTDIKIASATPSSTIVKEEYNLLDSDGNALGTSIKIYKDSHIVSITYITGSTDPHYQNLEYVYIDASGETKTEYVDISSLVLEAEFASGITVTEHVAHGVVDSTSEKDSQNTPAAFLTVGADGFKISGIKDEIDRKINALDADLSGNTTHVKVGVAEADGKITAVTVDETDIASQSLLDALSAKTVTAVAMTGGTADIVGNDSDGTKKITINTDGSQIYMTGYDKGSDSGAVATSDSINAAIGKLENQIAGKVDALDATVSGQTADGKVKVQVVQENGVLTTVTVTGTDIASADALTAETAARKAVDGQTGQTYAANTNSPYISGATDLNDADVKLAAALKALNDDTVKQVKVNNVVLAETDNAVNVQISAAAGTGASATPIVISTDNNTGAVTIQLEGLDCGTYN